MNKSLVLAGLIVASTSMMAMDTQYFIGAGAEKGNLDYKASLDIPSVGYNESISFDDSDTALKLKAGVILNKTHRISLSHTKFGDNDVDVRIILGNYDYLIPINNEFRLFAGLHLGNAKYTDTDINMSGLVYGGQFGAIYDITKNIEFELGFAYSKYNVDKSIDGNYSGVGYSIKTELDKSTSMFAGINYKF